MSGIGLFIALAMMCWWFTLWVFSEFKPCYLELLDNNLVKAFLFLVSYGFSYHLCTGIRHLIWDTGHGFSKNAINFSGWIVIFASIILTVVFWFYVSGGFKGWL
jgi:succinate dehydrogenase / fumarate reductase cytochrome b subunit